MTVCFGVRSEFSLGESSLSLEDAIRCSRNAGYDGFALTDTMTLASLISSSQKAAKEGMPLVSGCRLRVQVPDGEPGDFFYPKAYMRNQAGLKDLMIILSEAESAYVGRFIQFDSLVNLLSQDNVSISLGDELSLFSSALNDLQLSDCISQLLSACKRSHAVVSELVAVNTPYYIRQNIRTLNESPFPIIISQPVLYATDDGADARDVLSTIVRKQKMDSRGRHIPHSRTLHFRRKDYLVKSIVDQVRRSKDVFDWPKLTGLMVRSAPDVEKKFLATLDYKWQPESISLPKLAKDEFAALVELCRAGFKARIQNEVLGYKPSDALMPEYRARMISELKVLRELGFSNYFLIVHDLVNWCRDNGIIVGPGRGSIGGSLVAYLLNITDVDPIRFGLIFERFINPDRIDLPDADLDFMSTRRVEVIQYLKDTYGEDRVAGISNYNSMASASSVREVGRIHGLNPSEYACSKYIPKPHGQPMELSQAIFEVPELEKFATTYPDLWRLALGVEGKMRGLGQHAAGIVVSEAPLTDRAVVEVRKDENVVCWDKRVVEEMGLVKLDILGLSTLDILRHTLDKIKEQHGLDIDLLKIRLDDEKVLKAFGEGNTVAIFQFESGGMRHLLKDIASGKLLCFEDLSAATALYSPGRWTPDCSMTTLPIRKGAASENYEHPTLEPALKETNSVMVYQEQAMQIARDFAGFTMTESDHLRKAIGKKDASKMSSLKDKFVDGAVLTSMADKSLAERIWSQIEAFAGYGFNKSHSVEYSMISYWCMHLKVYYPVEFFAASLETHKQERLMGIVRDAELNGVKLLPPDINRSTGEFEIYGKDLLIPFNRVKGISDNTTNAILLARKEAGGSFKDMDDFLDHVEKRKCNIRHRANLEKIGAFVSIEPGTAPATHADRLKDQLELIPELITRNVVADRKVNKDKDTRKELGQIILECRAENGGIQPTPRLGRNPRFMVIFDCPSSDEERSGKMMDGLGADYVRIALASAGLAVNDGYFTTLCKTPKLDKQLSNDEVNNHKPFLDREIALMNPPVIVTLGSTVSRTMCPDEKGGIVDLAGKILFNATLDSSIVIGINPMMIYFDSSKQEMLDDIFKKVADLV